MKNSGLIWFNILWASAMVLSGCVRTKEKVDIPDVNGIYGNIRYLDSLFHTRQIDSIASVNDHLSATIEDFRQNIRTADDQVILDSLTRINSATHDFLRFCTESRNNLDLLETDVRSVETQHKSGKIQTGPYISALIEAEQVLVSLSNDLSAGYGNTIRNLKNTSFLLNRMSPIPVPGY
jgi:hypothetical protein